MAKGFWNENNKFWKTLALISLLFCVIQFFVPVGQAVVNYFKNRTSRIEALENFAEKSLDDRKQIHKDVNDFGNKNNQDHQEIKTDIQSFRNDLKDNTKKTEQVAGEIKALSTYIMGRSTYYTPNEPKKTETK